MNILGFSKCQISFFCTLLFLYCVDVRYGIVDITGPRLDKVCVSVLYSLSYTETNISRPCNVIYYTGA